MYIPATNPLESVYNWKSIVFLLLFQGPALTVHAHLLDILGSAEISSPHLHLHYMYVGIVGRSVVDFYCFHFFPYQLFSKFSILHINLQSHQDVAESFLVTVGSLWQDNLLGEGRCLIWSTFNFWEFWGTREATSWSLLDTNTTGVVMVSFQAPAFSMQVCWHSGQLCTERLPSLSHHHSV